MRVSVPLHAPTRASTDDLLSRALACRGGAIGEEVQPLPVLVAAEFVGTFILLLAVLMSPRAADRFLRPVQVPVLATLGTLIYVFGPISGALLNPAVSLSFVVKGEMPLSKFALFSASQMLGAAAATAVHGFLPDCAPEVALVTRPLLRWRAKLSTYWWHGTGA